MKSLTGKFSSSRGWAPLLILFLGAGLVVAACGDEEVPAPTTPAPPPPAPTPAPEPEPEPPAKPTGLMVSGRTESSITWTWNAVEGATGYVVQASRDEMFDDTDQLSLTAETSFTATQLPPETNVYFRVAAGVLTAAAPSLDPNDYLLSDWTTHVTGTTDAAASAAPAAPTAVRVTAQTDTTITWSWNAVDGAVGYQVQHGDSATIADDDPTAFASTTTHTVSNLGSRTDRYLRVRAYVGAISEPVFGDWSRTVEGTTDSPAAPVTTQLSAPTGLRADDETTTAITLSWGEVDDAETYEVQQRPADGAWGPASCGGGDSTVSVDECEATGLTRGSNYDFRVRAHPDPDDDTLRSSGWSSTASARTSGTPPAEPVTGGDDDLNITWESKATSITWFWDAASDNRFGYVTALLDDASPRPSCPALTSVEGGSAVWSDVMYANRYRTTFRRDGSTALLAGDVVGLCVRRTWMDNDDNQQYGPVSLAWAATAPAAGAEDQGTGRIGWGAKDNDSDKTTAIDWFVATDVGFSYDVRTASASVDGTAPSCSGSDLVGTTDLTGSGKASGDRFRLTSLKLYTQYIACARASNGQGQSEWVQINPSTTTMGLYKTLPGAPSLTGALKDTTADPNKATQVDVSVTWTFRASDAIPENPAGYQVYATTSDTRTSAFTKNDCAMTLTDQSSTLSETGLGFSFGPLTQTFQRNAFNANANDSKTGRVLGCVRALVDSRFGPWVAFERTVSVPEQAQQ